MRIVAIIPARGGSKGVPRKNLRVVGDWPLIVHAIRAAIKTDHIDAVYVTTEDKEIAEVSRNNGAFVIDRPSELAGDEVPSAPVIKHAASHIDASDVIVLVQATAYPQSSKTIDGLFYELHDQDADCSIAVRQDVLFMWGKDAVGYGTRLNQRRHLRRQDSDVEYVSTGAGYACRTEFLLKTGAICGGRVALYEDDTTILDIDTERDLKIARAIEAYHGNGAAL